VPPTRLLLFALIADVVAVVVFAALGQVAHDGSGQRLGLLATLGMFGLGLAAAWSLPLVRAAPTGLRAGAVVLVGTVVVGVALRAVVTGRLPLSFVLVAGLSLAVLLLGWRVLSVGVARRAARLH